MSNDLQIYKQELPGQKKLYSWNVIPVCSREECMVFDQCPHSHSNPERCLTISDYLDSVQAIILESYPRMSQANLYQVGMHLMPVYKTLCRLFLLEAGLNSIEYSARNGPAIHPVLKEIRNTIEFLDRCWRRLGLEGTVLFPDKPLEDPDEFGDNKRGNPTLSQRQSGLRLRKREV